MTRIKKDIACTICEEVFSTTARNARYCPECRLIRKKNSHKTPTSGKDATNRIVNIPSKWLVRGNITYEGLLS